MKKIIHLALRTEYSFQKTYGRIEEIVSGCNEVVGVADIENTFSHFYLNKLCKEQNKKPIFGVRLMVVRDPEAKIKPRGQFGPIYTFIAKNHEGLVEIHKLVGRAIKCMYFRRHVGLVDVWGLSSNVIVITPHFEISERVDYIALNYNTSKEALKSEIPKVAIINNQMIHADQKEVYQLFAGHNKTENFTYPTHILSTAEWYAEFKNEEAINNTHVIAEMCNVEFPMAEPVRYKGKEKIRTLCRDGAKKLGVNLKNPVYRARLKRELSLIRKKDFVDYFLIVAEMTSQAKEKMLVGPGRGSSGGSLVCYLIGITTVDPIYWDLLFERFIDVNRYDMPDIDIDFPDTKRQEVIERLVQDNGPEKVKNIATITTMKARSSIGDFAKELQIPKEDVENIKASIIRPSSGDARWMEFKNRSIKYTFEMSKIGKKFMERYPEMQYSWQIENHARNSGTHAAGIIVATRPLIEFASINPLDNTIQMEGPSAEKCGLLKMDCLGLTTLSVVEEVADQINMPYNDFYSLRLNHDRVFRLFRERKLRGIFQFEGPALSGLCRTIKVSKIDDIVAITALARPGPLHGGGAAKFSKIHQGLEEIEYVMENKDIEKITSKTMGVIVYQEQVMQILRDVGGFPWENVGIIRKLISKKTEKGALEKFRKEFVAGAMERNVSKEDAESAWDKIVEFAAYGFNKSHAVAYGMVSYWTAWCKAFHPMEFLVASLNSSGSIESKKRLLREMITTYGLTIVPVDSKLSGTKWTFEGRKLLGPLTNITGIGLKNAQVIMRKRETGEKHAVGVQKKLDALKTSYDVIFPCKTYWGEMFKAPKRYGMFQKPQTIEQIEECGKGEYLLISKLMKKNVRDLNELQNVIKRGGEVFTENTKLLNITVEDDTGSIMGRINRYDFNNLGTEIAEEGEEEKDWYLIRGKIISDEIIFLFISEIFKLGDGYSEQQTIRDIRD